jgi:hypothetical protein
MVAEAQERSNGMTQVIPPTFAAFQQRRRFERQTQRLP